jgi:hypothetical protein
MRGARALVRFLAFSISARSTGSGGGRLASFSANACYAFFCFGHGRIEAFGEVAAVSHRVALAVQQLSSAR